MASSSSNVSSNANGNVADNKAVVLPPPQIVLADMPADARKMCMDVTIEAINKYRVEKDQATHIKKALEAWNGAMWHVIIGTVFGASVAHDAHGFLLFRMGKIHCLCFMSFDESSLVTGKKEEHVNKTVQKKADDEEENAGGKTEDA